MISVRRSRDRGHADHGWLHTHHTFSFDTYRDENFMGFRTLRVINEDRVQPGQGFGTHPHRDMEILSYVLDGALEHQDNMGNGSVMRPGDVQRMSAGRGVLHSEFNHSDRDPLHFLQIWIYPKEKGIDPGYEQTTFSHEDRLGKLCLIGSQDGRDGSVTINQDVNVYASILRADQSVSLADLSGRHIWVQVASGRLMLNGRELSAGDGASVSNEKEITLEGREEADVLVFDLA